MHSILSGYNPHGPSQCKQLEKLKCFLEHINGYANAGYSTIQSKARYTILQCVMYHSAHPSWTPFLEYLSGVVDVRIQNVNRDTALHIATKKGLSKELLDILLCGHHGMEAANIPNNKARTALMEAIMKSSTSAVMALSPMTNIDNTDIEGKTALHYAIQLQESMYMSMLFKHNANVLVQDVEGNMALALACCLPFYSHLQLSVIFQLYQHGVAYGEHLNMI